MISHFYTQICFLLKAPIPFVMKEATLVLKTITVLFIPRGDVTHAKKKRFISNVYPLSEKTNNLSYLSHGRSLSALFVVVTIFYVIWTRQWKMMTRLDVRETGTH